MPGAGDGELLGNAVTMDMSTKLLDDTLVVTVTITNDKTGHHVPTDFPLRHMILLLEVTDSNGALLPQVDGPTIPEWGGVGDPAEGYFAQMPGTAYAKILMELWTEVFPTGSYWNPTQIMSDNRIPAFGVDTTVYTFETSGLSKHQDIKVTAQLLFRRAFITLMDQKSWDVPDILMDEQESTVLLDE
jgi:hypothetical protein